MAQFIVRDLEETVKARSLAVQDRREYVLDLTGLIARSQHFAPLMEDADMFAKIDIVDDGLGVAWPVETKWGHLDLSGSTLRRIAEEQLPMSGADFAKWRKSLGLSLTEAAKLLGVGRRTIMGYLKKETIDHRHCRRQPQRDLRLRRRYHEGSI
jgi:hypothetical protein